MADRTNTPYSCYLMEWGVAGVLEHQHIDTASLTLEYATEAIEFARSEGWRAAVAIYRGDGMALIAYLA